MRQKGTVTMKFFHNLSLDEVGAQLSDQTCVIKYIHAYNGDAADTIYIKLFIADTTPIYSFDVPHLVFAVPPSSALNADLGDLGLPPCFIQASNDAGAGATAPSRTPVVTIIYAVR